MPLSGRQPDGAIGWEVPRVESGVWVHRVQAPDAQGEGNTSLERTLLIDVLPYNGMCSFEDTSKVLAHDPQTLEGQAWTH